MGKKILYMDNCCLNRPYDDLSSETVRMEAEAVLSIINKCENGEYILYTSDVLFDEIMRSTDFTRRQKVLLLFQTALDNIELTETIIIRAKEIEPYGIKPFDALHIASAECGGADFFLTTDRKLKSAAMRSNIKIKVTNPLIWLTEVLYE
jgi:predicted nucleic acid-binding protein